MPPATDSWIGPLWRRINSLDGHHEVPVGWRALVTFLLDQLLPHAVAVERTLYPAAPAGPPTAPLA